MNESELPKVSVEEMQRRIATELSLRARVGYTALLLLALFVSVAIGSLWLTEPSLPVRTHIAFAAILVIGLSWVAYAIWVLTRRHVLLAAHRIVAARMGVAFSAAFLVGFAALGYWGPNARAGYGAAGTGFVMFAIAVAILRSARSRFDELMERRRLLEQRLTSRS
jgi:hypothetical protein